MNPLLDYTRVLGLCELGGLKELRLCTSVAILDNNVGETGTGACRDLAKANCFFIEEFGVD